MNLSTAQLLERLNRCGRTCSRSKLFRIIKRCGVVSADLVRGNPQFYGPEAIAIIESAIPRSSRSTDNVCRAFRASWYS